MSEQKDFMGDKLVLRVASLQDADLLLAWRNDPKTRAASHSGDEVTRAGHISWLTMALADDTRSLYIAEENGVPVGSVRADNCQGVYTLSWTVAPEARGRGLAKCMVALLADQLSGPIRAEIKADNPASCRVAEHAGMKLDRATDAVLHYYRPAR